MKRLKVANKILALTIILFFIISILVLSFSLIIESSISAINASNENGDSITNPRWFVYRHAVLYGFNYSNYDSNDKVNTLPDLSKPYDYLLGIKVGVPYQVLKLENQSSSSIKTGAHSSGSAYMNSNIIMVSGHGYGSKDGDKGIGVKFINSSLYTYDLNKMSNVDLAMWATCYSANSNNQTNTSMAQASVNAGAESSIGFPDTITVSSSRTFTNRLFKKLSEGKTIAESAKYAKDGLLWLWDNARDYVIYGNGNINITSQIVQNSIPSNNISLVSKFNDDIKNGEWKSFITGDNSIRYYKTINGLLSDIFYDVKYDINNNIIDIMCSKDSFDSNLVVKNLNSSAALLNIEEKVNISNVETYNVYVTINNEMVPVQLTYYDEYHNGGYTTQEVICKNLNDNTSIDYSMINSIQ